MQKKIKKIIKFLFNNNDNLKENILQDIVIKPDPVDKKFLRAVNILKDEYALKKSMLENSCIDREGNMIPWYTYSAIEYIKQLDFSDKRIFEFGSGNSSLYWANVAKEVISVEDNKEWYNSRLELKRENMKIMHKEIGEDYCNSILQENGDFDVIIVDAKIRDRCCESALKKIKNNGLIILDNSERALEYEEYSNSVRILKDADMIQVDFCGFGPINDYTWATSFFFTRDFNFKSKNHPIQPVDIIGQI